MLNAAIDPRLELLSVVQLLGQYNSWYRLLERDPAHPYVEAVQSWFGPFRGHEAVRLSDELGRFGFSFNAPVALMKALGWAGGLSPGGAKAPGAPASEVPPAGGLSPAADSR